MAKITNPNTGHRSRIREKYGECMASMVVNDYEPALLGNKY